MTQNQNMFVNAVVFAVLKFQKFFNFIKQQLAFFNSSYPNIVVVPANTPDDNFAKISKGFRHSRFPVVTWKSDNGALLVRGAGFTAQTMVTRLRKQANFLGGGSENQNMGYAGSYMTLNSRELAAPNSVELQVCISSSFVTVCLFFFRF